MPRAPKTDMERHPDKYFINPAGHIRDRILIHPSKDFPREGLFLSLNGYPFLAKVGVEIDIPRPLRQMIDTRIVTETFQGEDGKEYKRNIPRITYSLIKEGVNIPDTDASDSPDIPSDIPSAAVIDAAGSDALPDADWDGAE